MFTSKLVALFVLVGPIRECSCKPNVCFVSFNKPNQLKLPDKPATTSSTVLCSYQCNEVTCLSCCAIVWQGSVLISVTFMPSWHFGFKWHRPHIVFVQGGSGAAHASPWHTCTSWDYCRFFIHHFGFSVSTCCFRLLLLQFFIWICSWNFIFGLAYSHMSDSSSDTTHEAILHNVVSRQRRLEQQVQAIQSSVATLQQQLTIIQQQLQLLLHIHGHSDSKTTVASPRTSTTR